MNKNLQITLYIMVGIFIGLTLSHSMEVTHSQVHDGKYTNSQILFYDNMIQNVNEIELYNSSELTEDILTNRNGKIIVEKVVGEVTNYQLDGTILNANADNGTYITYKRVDGAKQGDMILTYFIYNPFTNEPDDVLTRMDFIIDCNAI